MTSGGAKNTRIYFGQRDIRCPSLQPDPRARPRLVTIIHNLKDRIQEARLNNWLGEAQGLQVSLNAAVGKLTSLDRIPIQPAPVQVALGMPIIGDRPDAK